MNLGVHQKCLCESTLKELILQEMMFLLRIFVLFSNRPKHSWIKMHLLEKKNDLRYLVLFSEKFNKIKCFS